MRSRDLARQPRGRRYLECPECAARIVHGGPHRLRLLVALALAVTSIVLMMLGLFNGDGWTIAGVVVGIVLLAWIYWCERQTHFVRYR